MALILGCSLGGIYRPGGRLGEVEDKKTGEDLLEDEVGLLRMKMDEANSVFQVAGRNLNSPPHGVEAFQGGGREALRIQVGIARKNNKTAVFVMKTAVFSKIGQNHFSRFYPNGVPTKSPFRLCREWRGRRLQKSSHFNRYNVKFDKGVRKAAPI